MTPRGLRPAGFFISREGLVRVAILALLTTIVISGAASAQGAKNASADARRQREHYARG